MVTGPEYAVSQVEIRHSDAAPGLGVRVCVVVGDEDGNREFFYLFSIIKDSHALKKYQPARNLKKVRITNVLVKILSFLPLVITSNLKFIGCSFQRLRMRRNRMMTSVREPWRFLYYIHYIVSDLRCNFLIDGYGIFPSLRCTISYMRNISADNLFISISSPSVSTLNYISSPYVYTLYSINSLFYPTLTKFTTRSLVDGGPICRVSTCFHPLITSRNLVNRYTCKALVNKSASICSVLQYEFFCFQPCT